MKHWLPLASLLVTAVAFGQQSTELPAPAPALAAPRAEGTVPETEPAASRAQAQATSEADAPVPGAGVPAAEADPSAGPAQASTPSPAEAADGAEQPVVAAAGGTRTVSGMSILGNEEAPKALVIVPWKSSQIGDGLGVYDSMDDRAEPVDKEVFMREVHYYDLRSGGEG